MTVEEAVNYYFSMGLMRSSISECNPVFVKAEKRGNHFYMYFNLTDPKTNESGYGWDSFSEEDIQYALFERKFRLQKNKL